MAIAMALAWKKEWRPVDAQAVPELRTCASLGDHLKAEGTKWRNASPGQWALMPGTSQCVCTVEVGSVVGRSSKYSARTKVDHHTG